VATPRDLAVAPLLRRTRLAAGVLGALGLYAAVRQGAFWAGDALVVTVVVLLVLALCAAARTSRLERQDALALSALLAVAAWWCGRAVLAHTPGAFLPFGASVLAAAGAFVVVRALGPTDRVRAAWVVAGLAGFVALAGVAGLIGRVKPLALVSQHTWRLASTITYSDAAGVLIAAGLLIALALDHDRRPAAVRVLVCLCSAGLVATQSRGALLACLCGCAFVPLARLWPARLALLSGGAVGVVAVVTSPSPQPQPWLAVALVAALACNAAWSPTSPVPARGAGTVRVALVLLALGLVAAELAHTEVVQRILSPSNGDRAVEWRAAWHQFAGAPLFGVGPDKLLTVHANDGTYAFFVHNEPLQVLADTGLLGLALLLVAAVALARVIRRTDTLTSCATGALAGIAVAGIFDFDWHLPVVGLLAGALAGLATAPQGSSGSSPSISAGKVTASGP
jgi:hypothetical protein